MGQLTESSHIVSQMRYTINLDLGLEKEKRRELRRDEERGGERRVRRVACGGDERGVEALAADISDRESEPRQAIVAASCGGNSRVLENDTQKTQSDRKPVKVATVFIRQYDGAEAITYGETVNVSTLYLQGYQGNLKWEYTSLLHHELTHVFQWDGEGQDYMILASNYYPEGFASRGMGQRWDQGYDFTARFLEYCEGLKPGFVAALNKKMRHNFSESFFVELLGKPVAQLWSEYKAKYGNIHSTVLKKNKLNN
ncbi:hypothetical protein SASPL_157495 [Salvia splendens]|uniref:Plant basic secretory protein (BSP) family protein n=1 Tax=Salvia splendens TaxID=180675 RepID=A0A8X8VUV6_SALSN|nr:hypothetical protein SASPL_157495 [Salvia splendens]